MDALLNEWATFQTENKDKIIKENKFVGKEIQYVGGLDISFDKNDNDNACAYLTIVDILDNNKIVYEDYLLCKMNIPYISGYLGFREIPYYKPLLDKIVDNPFYPQVLLVDGSGILHQREFGSASHIGLMCNIPTIGVAKSLLSHDGLNEKVVRAEFKQKCNKKGDYLRLVGDTGIIWGVALKTADNTEKPIYVTIGHMIDLDTAKNVVLKTCNYKNPEPIRNSDIKSKLYF